MFLLVTSKSNYQEMPGQSRGGIAVRQAMTVNNWPSLILTMENRVEKSIHIKIINYSQHGESEREKAIQILSLHYMHAA